MPPRRLVRLFCSRAQQWIINASNKFRRRRWASVTAAAAATSSSSDTRSGRSHRPTTGWLQQAAERPAWLLTLSRTLAVRPSVCPSVRPSPRYLVPNAQTTAASGEQFDRHIIKRTLTTSTAAAAAAGVPNWLHRCHCSWLELVSKAGIHRQLSLQDSYDTSSRFVGNFTS